jgi:hypothetical protein
MLSEGFNYSFGGIDIPSWCFGIISYYMISYSP